MALIAHGINRTTEDVDITLLLKLEDLEKIEKKILTRFDAVYDDPIISFQKNFVLPVIHKETQIGIDFAAGLTGFDAGVVKRRTILKFNSISLPFVSIEDLIIYKLFAGRSKDIGDVKEISNEFKNKLDKKYINKILSAFMELEREDMKKNFEKIF